MKTKIMPVETLGPATIQSPLSKMSNATFISEDESIG